MKGERVVRARGNRQSDGWLVLIHFSDWGFGGLSQNGASAYYKFNDEPEGDRVLRGPTKRRRPPARR